MCAQIGEECSNNLAGNHVAGAESVRKLVRGTKEKNLGGGKKNDLGK